MAFGAAGGEEALVQEPDPIVLRRIDQNVALLIKAQQADESRRKLSIAIGIAGIVFAAAKLGIIAIPHIKRWRSGEGG